MLNKLKQDWNLFQSVWYEEERKKISKIKKIFHSKETIYLIKLQVLLREKVRQDIGQEVRLKLWQEFRQQLRQEVGQQARQVAGQEVGHQARQEVRLQVRQQAIQEVRQ